MDTEQLKLQYEIIYALTEDEILSDEVMVALDPLLDQYIAAVSESVLDSILDRNGIQDYIIIDANNLYIDTVANATRMAAALRMNVYNRLSGNLVGDHMNVGSER